jgi:hypothetical protein
MSTKKIVKKTVKKKTPKKTARASTKKPKMIYWDELTPKQQAAYKQGMLLGQKPRPGKTSKAAGRPSCVPRGTDGRSTPRTTRLHLNISRQCINKAMCSDKENMRGVAETIKNSQQFATDWMVGTNITIITCAGLKEVIKYGTSSSFGEGNTPSLILNRDGIWSRGFIGSTPLPVAYRDRKPVDYGGERGQGAAGKRSPALVRGTKRAPAREGTMSQVIRKKAG